MGVAVTVLVGLSPTCRLWWWMKIQAPWRVLSDQFMPIFRQIVEGCSQAWSGISIR
jgi:hypothetical protein